MIQSLLKISMWLSTWLSQWLAANSAHSVKQCSQCISAHSVNLGGALRFPDHAVAIISCKLTCELSAVWDTHKESDTLA